MNRTFSKCRALLVGDVDSQTAALLRDKFDMLDGSSGIRPKDIDVVIAATPLRDSLEHLQHKFNGCPLVTIGRENTPLQPEGVFLSLSAQPTSGEIDVLTRVLSYVR